MKRLLSVVVAGLMGAVALIAAGPTSPAHAAGGWLSVPTVVRYNACFDAPYSFHLDLPPGYTYDVYLNVDVTQPDGTPGVGDQPNVTAADGRGGLFFCSGDMPGTYTASATGRACDYDYNCVDIAVPAARFTVRKPYTRTTISAKPKRARKGQVVSFKVTSKDERPNGYYFTDYTYILLQKKVRGRWVNVRGSRTYIDEGPWVLKYRWEVPRGKKVAVRAVTPSSGTFYGSVSRPVVIRTR